MDTFLAAAGLSDLAEIKARLAVSCAAGIRYVDPMVEAVGAEALALHLRSLQPALAGRALRRSSELDAHHGWVRVAWAVTDPAGRRALDGMHVFEHDPSGVLTRGLGFFGGLPARWFTLNPRR